MEAIVQLDAELAHDLQEAGHASELVDRLQQTLARFEGSLRPQHPELSDPTVSRYFILETRSPDDQQRALQALLAVPGVSAAYSKPVAELP